MRDELLDPTGMLLVGKLLGKAIDWLFDEPAPPPRPMLPALAPVRRHDLRISGRATSDVDVVIQHYRPEVGRVPVILTVQKFGKQDGKPLPMVLGDTAHLTMPRDHYLLTAVVFDLPTVPGAKPTLRGIGWAQPWVAANNTATIVIGTRRPTEPLVQRFGLTKQDGSPMFKLRTTPATGVTRTPRQLTSGAARTSSAGQCRARTDRVLTTIRCFQPAFSKGLCGTHLLQARSSAVYDYLTGKRIVL